MHTLNVANEVQATLVRKALIPEVLAGHFSAKLPLGHNEKWRALRIVIDTGDLGPVHFRFDRMYNFFSPEFLAANRDVLMTSAQEVEVGIEWSQVKRELVQLSRIVAGRRGSSAQPARSPW